MHLHIVLDDALVDALDRRAGPRRRSAFIAELVRRGLENERGWEDIDAGLGPAPEEAIPAEQRPGRETQP